MVEPEFRLVAIVFADKASYVKLLAKGLGRRRGLDLRLLRYGHQSHVHVRSGGCGGQPAGTVRSAPPISTQFLASPNAYGAVSTIVHEATHQIAFNSGLHQRLSDCPKWFSEGIAMYFETPDLDARVRTAGRAWEWSIVRGSISFEQYLQQRPADSLQDADQQRSTAWWTRSRPPTPTPSPGR